MEHRWAAFCGVSGDRCTEGKFLAIGFGADDSQGRKSCLICWPIINSWDGTGFTWNFYAGTGGFGWFGRFSPIGLDAAFRRECTVAMRRELLQPQCSSGCKEKSFVAGCTRSFLPRLFRPAGGPLDLVRRTRRSRDAPKLLVNFDSVDW